MHIHFTGKSSVAEMRKLFAEVEFRWRAVALTTASLWHIAACFAFADRTFTVKDVYNVLREYHPTPFTASAVTDIYQPPAPVAPLTSSILPDRRRSVRADRACTGGHGLEFRRRNASRYSYQPHKPRFLYQA